MSETLMKFQERARQSRLFVPGLIFLFFLGFYLLTAKGLLSSGDSRIHFMTTRSIVEERSIAISCLIDREWVKVGPDNQCYSKYEVGFAVTALPHYLIARMLFGPAPADPNNYYIQQLVVSTFNQLVTALTCVFVYLLALHIAGSKLYAFETTFLFGIATLAWPYASPFLTQPLIGLLLLVAVYLLITADYHSYRNSLLAGVALGWACFVRVDSVLSVGIIGLYLLYRLARQQIPWRKVLLHLGLVAGPVTIALLLYGVQNQIRGDTFVQVGYPGEGWTTPLWEGVYGLLFSPGKGLVFFSPLAFLALAGLVLLWRSGWKAEVALIGGLFIGQLIFYGLWWAWAGGWTWGPRLLVPAQALLVIGLLPWLTDGRRRIALVVVATLAFMVQLIGVTTDTGAYLGRTSYKIEETLVLPQASQIVGQLADLLALRIYSLIPTRAYGLLSQGQVLMWAAICLVLMIPAGLMLRQAVKE